MEITGRSDLYKLSPYDPITAELGVAEGLFSADICRLWKPVKHYAVDAWECMPHFKGDASSEQEWHNKNYKNALRLLSGCPVEFLRGPTVKMAGRVYDNTVNFINVDACHTYECVIADIHAWWPKLVPGGIMCFHDYENTDYGVKQAVLEWAHANTLTVNLLPENNIKDAGAWISKPTL